MNLHAEQKQRLQKLLLKLAILLGVGLAYFLIVKILGFGIPCVFHLLTDKYCPGCGISRMFVALFSGDFKAAFQYNALAFSLLLPALAFAVYRAYRHIRYGKTDLEKTWEKVLVFLVFLLTVAFTIMRNLSAFSFLAP